MCWHKTGENMAVTTTPNDMIVITTPNVKDLCEHVAIRLIWITGSSYKYSDFSYNKKYVIDKLLALFSSSNKNITYTL